jgi:hypothetical protein
MGTDHEEVMILGLGEQDLGRVPALLNFRLGSDPGLLGDSCSFVQCLLQLLLGVVRA